jgi:hypothetical protein
MDLQMYKSIREAVRSALHKYIRIYLYGVSATVKLETKTYRNLSTTEPHGFISVAFSLRSLISYYGEVGPPYSSAKPNEAYPPSPRLRRIILSAFIHTFTGAAFCEGR